MFKVLVVLVATASTAVAQTIREVPTEYPTIQAAVDAAAFGDTVLVQPGTYDKVSVVSKRIALIAAGGAALTAIDAGGVGTALVLSGAPSGTVVRGFTVRGGLGSGGYSGAGADDVAAPGGMAIVESAVLVEQCVIRDNVGGAGVAGATGIGGAGGILLIGGTSVVKNCLIENNQGGTGGPFQVVNTASAYAAFGGVGGAGGVALWGFAGASVVKDCTIVGNIGGIAGQPGIFGASAIGTEGGPGGVFHAQSSGWVERSVVKGNTGGNGRSHGIPGPPTTGSHAYSAAPGRGGAGGVRVYAPRVPGQNPFFAHVQLVKGSFITENIGGDGPPETDVSMAGRSGCGGVYQSVGQSLKNCTIAGNRSGAGVFGAFASGVFAPSLVNVLVWGNVPFAAEAEFVGGTSTNSLIGPSAVVSPGFVDPENGDFHLAADSIAIDGGTTAGLALPSFDIDGDPRKVGPAVDIGADEFDALTGTREELVLTWAIDGLVPSTTPIGVAGSGSQLNLAFSSWFGLFDGSQAFLIAQPFLPGWEPVGPTADIHIDPSAPFLVETFPALPTASVLRFYEVPPELAGIGVRIQVGALSASARNGVYATTAARDLVIE